MTPEEAKFILSATRFGTQNDSDDPTLSEAIAVAEGDPVLKKWLDESLAFDSAVSVKLAEISPPADLKSNILAGIRVSNSRPFWRKRSFFAAAAGLMIFAAAVFMAQPKAPTNDEFRSHFISEIGSLGHFDFVSTDAGEIQQWLAEKQTTSDFIIPSAVRNMPTLGCRVFDWNGMHASLICFRETEAEKMPTIHLVILDGNLISDLPEGSPLYAEKSGWATATWEDEGHTYLLASPAGEPVLRRYLAMNLSLQNLRSNKV